MIRWMLPVLTLMLTCACSGTPVRIESRALRGLDPGPTDRYIVAAVDNGSAPFLARAGGTPRGYDGIAAYAATSGARRLMKSVATDYGLREVSAWPIEPLHLHCAVLEIPTAAVRAQLLDRMAHDPRVKLAQPLQNFATRTETPQVEGYNDPYVALQRGFRQMNIANAHVLSHGDGVSVAIIDTGVDTRHPDLKGSIAAAANFVDDDAGQFQRDRHGTEVAGVIAAVANNHEGIVGIAPKARLFVFKACWQALPDADAASCNSFTLARALVAALDAHAQIINLSIAGPDDPLLADLIREGLRRGVYFVGAADERRPGDPQRLMSQPGIIVVGSAEKHSQTGADVYSPGREILTLMPGGHYDFASGDSIATAQVTGVVALLLARARGLPVADAVKILRETSFPSTTAGGERVDACAALLALVGRGHCPPVVEVERRLADDNGKGADSP